MAKYPVRIGPWTGPGASKDAVPWYEGDITVGPYQGPTGEGIAKLYRSFKKALQGTERKKRPLSEDDLQEKFRRLLPELVMPEGVDPWQKQVIKGPERFTDLNKPMVMNPEVTGITNWADQPLPELVMNQPVRTGIYPLPEAVKQVPLDYPTEAPPTGITPWSEQQLPELALPTEAPKQLQQLRLPHEPDYPEYPPRFEFTAEPGKGTGPYGDLLTPEQPVAGTDYPVAASTGLEDIKTAAEAIKDKVRSSVENSPVAAGEPYNPFVELPALYKKHMMPDVTYVKGKPYVRDPQSGLMVEYKGPATGDFGFGGPETTLQAVIDAAPQHGEQKTADKGEGLLEKIMPDVSGKDLGNLIEAGESAVDWVKKNYPASGSEKRISFNDAADWAKRQFTNDEDPAKGKPASVKGPAEAPGTSKEDAQKAASPGATIDDIRNNVTKDEAAAADQKAADTAITEIPAANFDDYIRLIETVFPEQDYTNPKQDRADANAERAQQRDGMLAQLALAAGMVSGAGPQWEGLGRGFGSAAGVYDKGFDRYQKALQDSADRYNDTVKQRQAYDLAKKSAALDMWSSAQSDRRAEWKEIYADRRAAERDAAAERRDALKATWTMVDKQFENEYKTRWPTSSEGMLLTPIDPDELKEFQSRWARSHKEGRYISYEYNASDPEPAS